MVKNIKCASVFNFVPPQPSCMLVLNCIRGAQNTAQGAAPTADVHCGG